MLKEFKIISKIAIENASRLIIDWNIDSSAREREKKLEPLDTYNKSIYLKFPKNKRHFLHNFESVNIFLLDNITKSEYLSCISEDERHSYQFEMNAICGKQGIFFVNNNKSPDKQNVKEYLFIEHKL